jgi:hypothetical protein
MHLKQCGLTDVADDLEAMRRWRNECDYEDAVGMLSLLVLSSLDGAERVLRTLQ